MTPTFTIAPIRAKNCTGVSGPTDGPCTPSAMAVTAPSAPPAETPSVCGVASGLRSRAWKTVPATASPPPASSASSTRGTRCMSTMLANSCEAPRPSRMPPTPAGGMAICPQNRQAAPPAAPTAADTAIVAQNRRAGR